MASGVLDAELARLRAVLWVNLASVAGGLLFVAALYLFVLHSSWLLVLFCCLALSGGALIVAQRFAHRGDGALAVVITAAEAAGIAAVGTWLAPAAMVVTSVVILLPGVLAAPFLRPAWLRWLLAATVVEAAALVALGRLQRGAGLEADLPGWAITVVAFVFIPLIVGLVALGVWQNHVGLWRRQVALETSRARLLGATDEARRQLEHDLRDGVQPALTDAMLRLQRERMFLGHGSGDSRAAVELDAALERVRSASDELRRLAQGVYPEVLTDHGLSEALRTVAARWDGRVIVRVHDVRRYAPQVEVSVYFCCLEAIQNALKHAGDTSPIEVSVRGGERLSFEVRDHGRGIRRESVAGHGVQNMRDRVSALGGTLSIQSTPNEGTVVTGSLRPGDPTQPLGIHRSTRRVLLTSLLAASASSVVLTAVMIFVAGGDGWVVANGAALLLGSGLLLGGLRALDRGDPERAVTLHVAMHWLYAPVVTLIAPFALAFAPGLLLVPVALAAPVFDAARMRRLVSGTVAMAVVLVCLGRGQNWSGLEDEIPSWAITTVLLLVVPGVTAIFVAAVWQNHVSLWAREAELRNSRARLVAATDNARRELERDLHDGAQQNLTAAMLRLQLVRRLMRDDRRAADEIEQVAASLRAAGEELRRLAHRVYPAVLSDHGLGEALRVLASRSGGHMRVVVADGVGRYVPAVEAGVYFSCLDAARRAIRRNGEEVLVTIHVWAEEAALCFEVADEAPRPGHALAVVGDGDFADLHDRVAALGGTLSITSPSTAGALVAGALPITSDAPGGNPRPVEATAPSTSRSRPVTAPDGHAVPR